MAQSTQNTSTVGTDWFMDYVRPHFTVRLKLHAALVLGGMGVGKTSWVLSLLAKAQQQLLESGIDDDEICILHTMEMAPSEAVDKLRESGVELGKVKYLYMFIDDAPAAEGLHSRLAKTRENVEESKFITMIRHRLAEMGYSGFVFVPFSTQVYDLIDPTVRRTARLKVFKDYPEEPNDLRTVGRMLGREYMAALRQITRMIYAPRSQGELHQGLSTAVVRFLGRKKVVELSFQRPRNMLFYRKENMTGDRRTEEKLHIKLKRGTWLQVERSGTMYIRTRVNGKVMTVAQLKISDGIKYVQEAWR